MNNRPWPVLLTCSSCGAETLLQRDQVLEALLQHNVMKRVSESEPELVVQLLARGRKQLTCSNCDEGELVSTEPDSADGDDWGERDCASCANSRFRPNALKSFPIPQCALPVNAKTKLGEADGRSGLLPAMREHSRNADFASRRVIGLPHVLSSVPQLEVRRHCGSRRLIGDAPAQAGVAYFIEASVQPWMSGRHGAQPSTQGVSRFLPFARRIIKSELRSHRFFVLFDRAVLRLLGCS